MVDALDIIEKHHHRTAIMTRGDTSLGHDNPLTRAPFEETATQKPFAPEIHPADALELIVQTRWDFRRIFREVSFVALLVLAQPMSGAKAHTNQVFAAVGCRRLDQQRQTESPEFGPAGSPNAVSTPGEALRSSSSCRAETFVPIFCCEAYRGSLTAFAL